MHFAETDSAPSASSSSVIGELGSGGEQRSQCAGGNEFVVAAEIGDDGLAHGAVDAFVLGDLNVAAFAGLFEAEERGALAIEHHGI
jgi:hypothetical protein